MTPNSAVAAGNQLPPTTGMKTNEESTSNAGVADSESKPSEQPTNAEEKPAQTDEPAQTDVVKVDDCPASPQFQHQVYHHAYLPHLTPQQGGGYYLYGGSQVTPEPPSPATPGYDVNSFLQQQAALGGVHPGNPFAQAGQYGGISQTPLSPNRTSGLIPPPSPLFPRVAGNYDPQNHIDSNVLQRIHGQTAGSTPTLPYMTAATLGVSSGSPSFGAAYTGYAVTGTYATALGGGSGGEPTADEFGWGDRSNSQQLHYAQASPHQGPMMYPGMSRAAANNRSYSFDELLPPSALDHQDQASAPYSPYSTNHAGSASNLFAHQQSWGYSAAGDMYNPPQSPLQPRQTTHMQGHFAAGHAGMGQPQMHLVGPYGNQPQLPPFYPATSPGPPIQTTASNKGPDGANLFIFHIPNHFTNMDMFRLFCQYGNLLSVRIMVEKDTGRSRGFGFVSYDSPESAALAIKELNGFAIGNKRLKVQHKQIRGDHMRGSFESNDGGFIPHGHDFQDGSGEQLGLADPHWYDAPGQGVSYGETHDEQETERVESAEVAAEKGSADQSPLTNLEPLRAALPEVAGPVGIVE